MCELNWGHQRAVLLSGCSGQVLAMKESLCMLPMPHPSQNSGNLFRGLNCFNIYDASFAFLSSYLVVNTLFYLKLYVKFTPVGKFVFKCHK